MVTHGKAGNWPFQKVEVMDLHLGLLWRTNSFGAATKCQSCVRDSEAREREGGKSPAQP